MRYTLENTINIGQPKRVFDANGLEWTHVLECDTETGEIIRQKTDENGKIVIDYEMGEVVTERIITAAPLMVVPKNWNKD